MDPQTALIIAAFLGGPTAGAIVNRYVKPKSSVMERLESLEQAHEALGDDFRILQDYTHTLREHIASGKPPPPPPWPDGLTQ